MEKIEKNTSEINKKIDDDFSKNKKALTKIWTVFSVFATIYVLDTWLLTQSVNLLIGKILDKREHIAALYGIIIGSFSFILSMIWLNLYIEKYGGNRWRSKFPTLFNLDLNTNTTEGKLYQGICFFTFHIIPFLSQIHFVGIFLKGKLYVKHTPETVSLFKLEPPSVLLCDCYRYGAAEGRGVTFFPFYEPILIFCVEIFLAIVFFKITRKIFKKNTY